MNRLLLPIFLLLAGLAMHAPTRAQAYSGPAIQYGYGSSLGTLWVKKKYHKKVKTYQEGERIILQVKNDSIYNGLITLLLNDTIYLGSKRIARADVTAVLLNRRKKERMQISAGNLLLITGGVALVTAGLTVSNQAGFREALTAGAVIGYGPLALKYLGSKIDLRRKRYRIGGKFRLTMMDMHLPRRPAPRPF